MTRRLMSTFSPLALLLLAACGGSSGGLPTTQPAPFARTVVSGGLNDPAVSTPFAVSIVGIGSTETGQLTPSAQEASTGGRRIAVANPDVNLGLGAVSVLNGDQFAYLPVPDGTPPPTGNVSYSGQGLIVVTESASSTVYQGTVDANLSVRIDGVSSGTLRFTNFDGTKQIGAIAPVDTTGQGLTVRGIVASSSGLSAGTSITENTFSNTDFSGADFDIEGAFAGADFGEVAGLVDITASDGSTVRAAFGAAR